MKKFKKTNKGITLIALVITIIILLILAGLTISSLTESGLFQKAEDAEIKTRAESVEEQVTLWKSENFASSYTKDEKISAEKMLEDLKSKKLIYEEEIDRDNEVITIKKKDGTVVKEISYADEENSKVKINISKTPETQKAGTVLLEVTSVEGFKELSEEESSWVMQTIAKMNDETKRELIKLLFIKIFNDKVGTSFTELQEVLMYDYSHGGSWVDIGSKEENFWEFVESRGGYNNYLMQCIVELYYNEDTLKLENYYIVINPEGKILNQYVAIKNGTYTFTVQNVVTGEKYTESIEVKNIDENIPYYGVNYFNVDEYGVWSFIKLADKITNESVLFDEIYVIYNGEKLSVTDYLVNRNEELKNLYTGHIAMFLRERFNLDWESYNFLEGKYLELVLVKDGIEYIVNAMISLYAE